LLPVPIVLGWNKKKMRFDALDINITNKTKLFYDTKNNNLQIVKFRQLFKLATNKMTLLTLSLGV